MKFFYAFIICFLFLVSCSNKGNDEKDNDSEVVDADSFLRDTLLTNDGDLIDNEIDNDYSDNEVGDKDENTLSDKTNDADAIFVDIDESEKNDSSEINDDSSDKSINDNDQIQLPDSSDLDAKIDSEIQMDEDSVETQDEAPDETQDEIADENLDETPDIDDMVSDDDVVPLKCGNGQLDAGEECDDGNASNNDACLNSCKLNVCGDGYVREFVEDCDTNPVPCSELGIGTIGEAPCGSDCNNPVTEGYCKRIYSCGLLPAGAKWNTVPSFEQTWNGHEWEPEGRSGTYNIEGSQTGCYYVCDDYHSWYNSECKPDFYLCTGIENCYDNTGVISCPSDEDEFFGQDKQYADLGNCITGRYKTHEWSAEKVVVHDVETGVYWQKIVSTETYTWQEARGYCNSIFDIFMEGDSLPSLKNLLTIVYYGNHDPAVNTDVFPGIQSKTFWTSSSRKSNSSQAWYVDFTDGSSNYDDKENKHHVVCSDWSPSFDDEQHFSSKRTNGKTIVSETLSHLKWAKPFVTGKTWEESLSYCENLVYGGFKDWRMPNVNELKSLVNVEEKFPASEFPGMPSATFWSSSTNVENPEKAWVVDMSEGNVLSNEKTDLNYVKCLRYGDSYPDMDSDSDGIFDRKELDFGTDPYNKDTDGDGNDDLEEIMYGSDPLDENDLLPEDVKYAIAIYKGEDNDVKSFTFTTDIKAVDILLMVDESGGMAGEVDALKNEIKTHIIDFVETEFPTLGFAAYGLATFGYETMYEMVQTMTLDNDEIQSAVNMLDASQSNELITEALYQATTGEGIEGHYYVNVPGFGKFEHQDVNVPGQNCNGKLGKIGGACFREKSWPIYVVVTDEAFTFAPLEAESGPGDTILWEWSDPEPHSVEETLAVMNNLGAKFIGIDTGFDDEPPVQELNLAQEDLDYFAQNTGSFYGSNEYSFIYHSPNEDGSGIGGVIGNAVVDLLRNINMDVTVIGVSDDTCNGIPAGEFISEIRTIYADPADWISGMDIETFYNVVPGTILRYDIHFGNDFCENTSDEPMMFELTPTAQGNGSYLSEGQKVFIIVP